MKPKYFAVFVEYRDDDGCSISDWAIARTRDDALDVLEDGGVDLYRVYYESGAQCATWEEADMFIYGERFKRATPEEAYYFIKGEQFVSRMLRYPLCYEQEEM